MISFLSKLATLITLADAKIHLRVLRAIKNLDPIPVWGKPYEWTWRLILKGKMLSSPVIPKLEAEQWERLLVKVIDARPKRYCELTLLLVKEMAEILKEKDQAEEQFVDIAAVLGKALERARGKSAHPVGAN